MGGILRTSSTDGRNTMVRRILCLLLLTGTGVSAASEVALLRSDDFDAYNQTAEAVVAELGIPVAIFDLEGDRERADEVIGRLRRDPPKVIIALGKKAAYAANEGFREVPILYAQVEDPERYGLTGFNISGVSQEVSMDEVLSYLRLFAPEVERIGMLIWQKNQNQQVAEAIEAGKSAGYTVRALRVGHERDVPGAFQRLRREIDAFWLVPDHLVVTPENFRFLRDETQRLEMPLIAYTDALVRAGALMGVGPDRDAIGRQLAEMARSILQGTPIEDLPIQTPQSVRVVLNRDTQNAIGLDIDPAMLGFVDEVLQVEGR